MTPRQQYSHDVGKWVLEQRTRLGITQQELADLVGVGQSTVAKWERGSVMISGFSRSMLSKIFKRAFTLRGDPVDPGPRSGKNPSAPTGTVAVIGGSCHG